MTTYYVSRQEYDKIAVGESESIEIYRKSYDNGSINRYENKEGKKIAVDLFESEGKTYKLEYKQIDVPKIDYRKPHQLVKKDWDERVEELKKSIHEQESTLDKYVQEDLKGIRANLFVKPEYANVVETKLNELRKNLASLNLELDKLKDHYEKVGAENSNTSIFAQAFLDH